MPALKRTTSKTRHSPPGRRRTSLNHSSHPNDPKSNVADLESRNTLLELPRLGDRIQTYSADVAVARKTVRRSHWVFNVDCGALLTTGSVVMACLDLEARRAIEITGELRTMFEQRYFPDLCCDQSRSFRRVE
jgi:hypothetical protein